VCLCVCVYVCVCCINYVDLCVGLGGHPSKTSGKWEGGECGRLNVDKCRQMGGGGGGVVGHEEDVRKRKLFKSETQHILHFPKTTPSPSPPRPWR